MGEGIKELKLNLYGIDYKAPNRPRREFNLYAIVNIIKQCTKLNSLGIRLVNYFDLDTAVREDDDDFENFLLKDGPFSSCLQVIENV